MLHRDKIVLKKIISEIDIGIKILVNVTWEEFSNNEVLKRAVAMTVVNIGELVKNITEELRLEYKYVPWKLVAGMRDIVAHKYQTLRMEDVYNTVKINFPEFKNQLIEILNNDNRK